MLYMQQVKGDCCVCRKYWPGSACAIRAGCPVETFCSCQIFRMSKVRLTCRNFLQLSNFLHIKEQADLSNPFAVIKLLSNFLHIKGQADLSKLFCSYQIFCMSKDNLTCQNLLQLSNCYQIFSM